MGRGGGLLGFRRSRPSAPSTSNYSRSSSNQSPPQCSTQEVEQQESIAVTPPPKPEPKQEIKTESKNRSAHLEAEATLPPANGHFQNLHLHDTKYSRKYYELKKEGFDPIKFVQSRLVQSAQEVKKEPDKDKPENVDSPKTTIFTGKFNQEYSLEKPGYRIQVLVTETAEEVSFETRIKLNPNPNNDSPYLLDHIAVYKRPTPTQPPAEELKPKAAPETAKPVPVLAHTPPPPLPRDTSLVASPNPENPVDTSIKQHPNYETLVFSSKRPPESSSSHSNNSDTIAKRGEAEAAPGVEPREDQTPQIAKLERRVKEISPATDVAIKIPTTQKPDTTTLSALSAAVTKLDHSDSPKKLSTDDLTDQQSLLSGTVTLPGMALAKIESDREVPQVKLIVSDRDYPGVGRNTTSSFETSTAVSISLGSNAPIALSESTLPVLLAASETISMFDNFLSLMERAQKPKEQESIPDKKQRELRQIQQTCENLIAQIENLHSSLDPASASDKAALELLNRLHEGLRFVNYYSSPVEDLFDQTQKLMETEKQFPLIISQLEKLVYEQLANRTPEELTQLYRSLAAMRKEAIQKADGQKQTVQAIDYLAEKHLQKISPEAFATWPPIEQQMTRLASDKPTVEPHPEAPALATSKTALPSVKGSLRLGEQKPSPTVLAKSEDVYEFSGIENYEPMFRMRTDGSYDVFFVEGIANTNITQNQFENLLKKENAIYPYPVNPNWFSKNTGEWATSTDHNGYPIRVKYINNHSYIVQRPVRSVTNPDGESINFDPPKWVTARVTMEDSNLFGDAKSAQEWIQSKGSQYVDYAAGKWANSPAAQMAESQPKPDVPSSTSAKPAGSVADAPNVTLTRSSNITFLNFRTGPNAPTELRFVRGSGKFGIDLNEYTEDNIEDQIFYTCTNQRIHRINPDSSVATYIPEGTVVRNPNHGQNRQQYTDTPWNRFWGYRTDSSDEPPITIPDALKPHLVFSKSDSTFRVKAGGVWITDPNTVAYRSHQNGKPFTSEQLRDLAVKYTPNEPFLLVLKDDKNRASFIVCSLESFTGTDVLDYKKLRKEQQNTALNPSLERYAVMIGEEKQGLIPENEFPYILPRKYVPATVFTAYLSDSKDANADETVYFVQNAAGAFVRIREQLGLNTEIRLEDLILPDKKVDQKPYLIVAADHLLQSEQGKTQYNVIAAVPLALTFGDTPQEFWKAFDQAKSNENESNSSLWGILGITN